MEIINDLHIDIEALIAFKTNDDWSDRRPIVPKAGKQDSEGKKQHGLPGTLIGRMAKKEVQVNGDDANSDEFKIYILSREIPVHNGIEGIKVNTGRIKRIPKLGGKCRVPHHVEVKRCIDNCPFHYKYSVVIHYKLKDPSKCEDSHGLHEDPTVVHPDKFP